MAIWYVSTAGNDGSAGSFVAPWQTLGKLESSFGSLITAGDTIRLRAGDIFTDSMLYNAIKTNVTLESYDPITGSPSAMGTRATIRLAVGTVIGAPSGANNVTISNIDLQTLEATSGSTQHSIISNDAGSICLNWIIKNCLLHQAGGSGIIINGTSTTGWTIDSNEIYNLGDNGILLNSCGGGHIIKNNRLYNIGLFNAAQGRHGIYAKCHDYTIKGNEFYNCPNGQAISMRNNGVGSSGIAYLNYVHDTPYGIAFFANGDLNTGTLKAFANRIINVSIYGVYVGESGAGIYFDTVIANNTIVGTGVCIGIDCSDVVHANSTVKNNIVVGGQDAFYANNAAMDVGKTITEDYNLYYGQTQASPFKYLTTRYNFAGYKGASGQSAHSLALNPLLGSSPIYGLSNGSPAIDAGTTSVTGLTYTSGDGSWSANGLVYAGSAPDLGATELLTANEVFETGWQTLTEVQRGYVGFSLEPYYYDFSIDYISATEADFVRFTSIPFSSITPVRAVTLVSSASGPANLLDSTILVASGDAAVSTGAIAKSTPSTKIVRDGTQWFGGLVGNVPAYLGDPKQASVAGNIYVVGQVRGLYRLALVDFNGSVGWIRNIENLKANQWNNFTIPIDPNLLPAGFRLFVQQAGFYPDTFYVDELALKHSTVSWEASADSGTTWQPFYTSLDEQYSGVKFVNPGTGLQVRATAVSDRAWLTGYKLIPQYGYTGRRH